MDRGTTRGDAPTAGARSTVHAPRPHTAARAAGSRPISGASRTELLTAPAVARPSRRKGGDACSAGIPVGWRTGGTRRRGETLQGNSKPLVSRFPREPFRAYFVRRHVVLLLHGGLACRERFMPNDGRHRLAVRSARRRGRRLTRCDAPPSSYSVSLRRASDIGRAHPNEWTVLPVMPTGPNAAYRMVTTPRVVR
jgi:hypothetical protein